eukprot:739112-Alexandrium_andersonii.AAC.1
MAITAPYHHHNHSTHAVLKFRPALQFPPSQFSYSQRSVLGSCLNVQNEGQWRGRQDDAEDIWHSGGPRLNQFLKECVW